MVEPAQLFARGVGEATDIVKKEMYVFEDKGEDLLALRPEGTAGTVRAFIEHGAFVEGPQKWFYVGPMFRRERPQKGRYRQFHQIGCEAFGIAEPFIDAEQIALLSREPDAQFVDDGAGDLVLDGQDVREGANESLAPELRLLTYVHQVCLDVQRLAALQHSSCQHRSDLQTDGPPCSDRHQALCGGMRRCAGRRGSWGPATAG